MYIWPCHLIVGMDTGVIRKGFIRHFHVYNNIIAPTQPRCSGSANQCDLEGINIPYLKKNEFII